MQLHSYRAASLIAFLVSYGVCVGHGVAQPGVKRPSTPDDYQRRTLKEIFAMKPDEQDMRDMQGRLLVTRNTIPSAVQVTYTGSSRVLPQMKKESIRQWARLYAGSMEHYTVPYQTEMLFLENGVRYWLAVNRNSPLLKRELKNGDKLDLYLIRLGASVSGNKYDWTLLVEEFQQRDSSRPVAEIKFVESRFGTPPLLYLTVDLLLRNDTAASRWFLLPSNLGPGHGPVGEKGGVDVLEVFSPPGTGSVTIGHFLGTGGFNALLLSPHSEVRLRRFPVSYWGDPPEDLKVEVVIAKRLMIGGDSAEAWFAKNPLCSKRADILEDAESARKISYTKHAPDKKEVAVTIDVEQRSQIPITPKK